MENEIRDFLGEYKGEEIAIGDSVYHLYNSKESDKKVILSELGKEINEKYEGLLIDTLTKSGHYSEKKEFISSEGDTSFVYKLELNDASLALKEYRKCIEKTGIEEFVSSAEIAYDLKQKKIPNTRIPKLLFASSEVFVSEFVEGPILMDLVKSGIEKSELGIKAYESYLENLWLYLKEKGKDWMESVIVEELESGEINLVLIDQ